MLDYKIKDDEIMIFANNTHVGSIGVDELAGQIEKYRGETDGQGKRESKRNKAK